MEIIGRNKEISQLNELYNSKKAEFVVVYGRRRVGKTFLIDAAMEGKITFRHAGLSPIEEEEGTPKRRGFLLMSLKPTLNFFILQVSQERIPR